MSRGTQITPEVRQKVYLRSGGECEARLFGCSFHASDLHHRKARARGGSNDPRNLLHVCRSCHAKITDNRPDTARFRTFRDQTEGVGEDGIAWQPEDKGAQWVRFGVKS